MISALPFFKFPIEAVEKLQFCNSNLLEPVQNLEFWRCKRQNSTLQAQKEPENRDFCGLLAAKIHNLNRLLKRHVS
jgi:hypothetical protein